MRRWAALILMISVLFSCAFAESTQKAPDYILEGYDGDLNYRNWDTNLFFSRMQEKTGISFQFRQWGDYQQWTDRKAEILEGKDLPDVLFKAELSSAETRDLYTNGLIIDLSPYLEEYAPNLWKLLEDHPEWKQAVSMPDGAIPALPCFNQLQNNDAMWLNTDWLKKLKLEVPGNAEELTEVLRAFKTGDPNGNYKQDEVPLTFIGMWELRFLGHAFGMTDNDYYLSVSDGTVSSSLTSGQNRSFLEWLHQLWQEGLIDHKGFISADSMRQITDEKTVNPYGMLLSSSPLTVLTESSLKSFSLLEPLEYNGKRVYRDLLGDLVQGTFALTRSCANPEKLVAWVDYLYTQEGNRLAVYGQEGEEYTWNEDGYWEWTASLETVANEYLPQRTISEGGAAPGLTDTSFQLKYSDENTRRSVEQLTALKQYSVIPFPQVVLNAEDEARIAEIQKELSAWAEQSMARFVTGDIELTDETWDEFCRTAGEKGLAEMISLWQKYVK